MAEATPPLLIVWHSRTGTAQALARAAFDGAGARARMLPCDEVAPADMLAARGYLFIAPENLAVLSGAMKEMFDRCYYPLLGRIEGRAYSCIVAAGTDGTGAQRQIERICTGWRLRRVSEAMIVLTGAQTAEAILAPKVVTAEAMDNARELGAAMAEALAEGIF